MNVTKTLDHASIEEQDLVSRYIGRKLSPEEAEAFEEHYFGCDRCWEEVQAATEVRAALANEPASRSERPAAAVRVIRGPWRSLLYLAAAAAVALVAAGILVTSRSRPLDEIIRASGQLKNRVVPARLSERFPYLPLERTFRGPDARALPLDLRRAALDAQKRALERPSLNNLRGSGLSHLVVGELDEAIAQLEEARNLERDPPANLLSDLGAAYYSRGAHRYDMKERDRALADFESALKMVRGALKKDPLLPAALFNHALILESTGFRSEAAAGWRRYLEVDPASGWAEEAKAHLARLTAATSLRWDQQRSDLQKAAETGQTGKVEWIAAHFGQPSRQFIQDQVLPDWGSALVAGRADEASKSLAVARVVGDALARTSGDFLLRDAVGEIDRAIRLPRGMDRVRQLAEGYRLYGRGRVLFKKHEIEPAIAVLERSYSFLSSASPFTAQIGIVLASSRFYQSDFAACDQLLDVIETQLGRDPPRYGSIVGQLHWLRGVTQLSRGHPAESLKSYRIALEQFQRLNETENLAAAHSLLAENLQYLGDLDGALDHRDQALTLLSGLGDSPQLIAAVREMGLAALARGYDEIALAANERLASLSRGQNSPVFTADALLLLSLAQQRVGNLPAAIRTEAEARAAARTIGEAAVQNRTRADLDFAEALLWKSEDPNRALRCLTSAIDYFLRVENHYRLAQAYFERGLLKLASGQKPDAERDLAAAIEELEAERARIPEDVFRLSYFENSKDVFAELIALLAHRGDAVGALSYAERSKARALLDEARFAVSSRAPAPPLDGQSIAERIPESVALIEYRVLPDSVLAWVVRSRSVRMNEIAISARELKVQVDKLLRSMQAEGPAGTRLYDLLIRPLGTQFRGGETLVIVPDKVLNDVPFAALQDSRTGHYLIQDYRLATSPSGTFFIECFDRQRRTSVGPPRSALAVQNPAFDSAAFPSLKPLPFAESETRQIVATYPVAEVQKEEGATKTLFLERAPKFEIVDFAGHAVVNEQNPSLSLLLFAPDLRERDSGRLYAHEIASSSFTKTRLVVLAACGTSRGQVQDVEGVLSIARAFLGAGAPAVLATLREVDDEATARLLEGFHRRLAEGDHAADALRSTQLAMLSGPDSTFRKPGAWAPFVMVGWL